jgi:hypothetical protein
MNANPYKFFRHFILLLPLLGLLGGCASTQEMSLKRDTQALDLKDKGLILMSLQLKHDYKPKYQPNVLLVLVESANGDSKGDTFNIPMDEDSKLETGGEVTYLLRMALDPGQYVIREAVGTVSSFPITAFCRMPIHENIEVRRNNVAYVGRVRGVTRKRQEGEFRSGSLIPLLDQGVSGFAHSTFDVEVSDQRNADLKAFQTYFPALTNADIHIDILPPFNRQRAQMYWDSEGKEDGSSAAQNVSAGASEM